MLSGFTQQIRNKSYKTASAVCNRVFKLESQAIASFNSTEKQLDWRMAQRPAFFHKYGIIEVERAKTVLSAKSESRKYKRASRYIESLTSGESRVCTEAVDIAAKWLKRDIRTIPPNELIKAFLDLKKICKRTCPETPFGSQEVAVKSFELLTREVRKRAWNFLDSLETHLVISLIPDNNNLVSYVREHLLTNITCSDMNLLLSLLLDEGLSIHPKDLEFAKSIAQESESQLRPNKNIFSFDDPVDDDRPSRKEIAKLRQLIEKCETTEVVS